LWLLPKLFNNYNSIKMKTYLVIFFILIAPGIYSQQAVPCRCQDETTGKKSYGYCDPFITKYIIKCQFDSAFSFSNDMARVTKDGKFGYVDALGKQVIPMIYEDGGNFSNGFAYVKKDGHHFYINKLGLNQFKKNFPLPAMRKMPGMSDGVKKMMAGYTEKLKESLRFSDGMALVYDTLNKKVGYIDTKGISVIPFKYVMGTPFSEGVAFVRESPTSPSIAIGKTGQVLFELDKNTQPDQTKNGFVNGFAVVVIQNREQRRLEYNYIDKKGKLLLAESVQKAEPFAGNFAVITNNADEMVLIDRKGAMMFDQSLKYLSSTDIKGIYFYSNQTERGYGLIDSVGTRRTEAKYINFTKLNETVFLCKGWGTSIYHLLSIKKGELLYANQFTQYEWMAGAKNPVLRLSGQDILANDILLDYEPASGKFLKDGKEAPTKDIRFLAENYLDNKELEKQKSKLKAGIVKYENAYFSLRFPEEMELFKDTVGNTTYRKSTYYFSIKDLKWTGTGDDYLNALINRMQSTNKYATFEKERINLGGEILDQLVVTSKDDRTQGRLFFIPLSSEKTKAGANVLYVISGNYFVTDERICKPNLMSTLSSIKYK
jgi:WG containing repeat